MNFLWVLDKLPHTKYCERGISSILLAEPINAITNFAYILTGFLGYKLLQKAGVKDKQLLILPWLLFTVGLGSFIYHTARNCTTLLFDAIPIFIFILYALFLTLKELYQIQLKALIILLGFVVVEVVLSMYIPREFLNGSVLHLAAIILVSLIGMSTIRKYGYRVSKPLIAILGFYGMGIIFRSIDLMVCPFIPIGTHFLWHIFAAFAGYQVIIFISVLKSKEH